MDISAKNKLEEEPGGSVPKQEVAPPFINSLNELSQLIPIEKKDRSLLNKVIKRYHMRIPLYYLNLIKDRNDINDPIRMQCVPSISELVDGPFSMEDPLSEEKTSVVSCLVHRYPDRVLLLVTNQCFMYCRHCTRKRLWKTDKQPTIREIRSAISYLSENPSIREVIISGGDPLTLPTKRIDLILSWVSNCKNVEVVRIGTRVPVVYPQRIDDELCAALKKYDKLWINTQFNHPNEITEESTRAVRMLQSCGIPISNQSVLLKGVNDNIDTMKSLCQKLQSIRVRPYYLYQCDLVVGAEHFRTSVSTGVEIIDKMRGYTSGMCIPTFVVDGLEGKGKVPVNPEYIIHSDEDGIALRNYRRELFYYPNPRPQRERPLFDNIQQRGVAMKKKIKKVGIVFNLKKEGVLNTDDFEEYDEIETINAIKNELEAIGFDVHLFEQHCDLPHKLSKNPVDFVLNIAEGLSKGRNRELEVPALLESLGIPYSGSDSLSIGLTQDKYLTNKVLLAHGVKVPRQVLIKSLDISDELQSAFEKEMPLIIKPRWEGSSKGVFIDSVVNNMDALFRKAKFILNQYNQPAIAEEFLPGEEITVGVSGYERPYILGLMRIRPKSDTDTFIYSLEVKRDWERLVEYEPETAIDIALAERVKEEALKAYLALELRDFARIDFRTDSNGVPKVIDINPLPGLSPRYSDLPIIYKLEGKSYSSLIQRLIADAFERLGVESL